MPKTFNAKVIAEGSALGWRIVDIPFDVKKTFQVGGRVAVKGTVNGFPFRSSLFARKSGPHFLMLNKAMQKGAGATEIGDTVRVEIEVDTEKRKVVLPAVFKTMLGEDKDLARFFGTLNYSTRKWMVDAINQPKSVDAQKRRAEQMMMRLYEVRDGEIEPPPILQAAFARNPKARIGWDKLPPTHKRGHLLGIFASLNPETRERRLEKAVDMMLTYADKKPRAKK